MDQDKPGPTGDFPEGKLNPHDEGGLMIAINAENGVVKVDFGKPVHWIGLRPDGALEFASLIVGRAMEIKRAEEAGREGA